MRLRASCFLTCVLAAIFNSTASSPDAKSLRKYNERTSAYYVNGATIPEVFFDIGESYAGQMAIGNDSALFFWFVPTDNPAGRDDIVIWFNGGPGCSSLEGFVQENGPFSWKPGTEKPIANPWSWHKLANVVWVEYPVGTGFSRGPITARDNNDLALQFLNFWANFTTTFDVRNSRISVAGESYAGVHVPYVGSALLELDDGQNNTVQGALIYDPVLPYVNSLGLAPASVPAFARYWRSLLGFPIEGTERVEEMSKRCQIDDYLDQHLTYPPPKRPWAPVDDRCPVMEEFTQNAIIANNCWNIYNILDYCPKLSNAIGFPGEKGSNSTWPNRPDVQKALHVEPDPSNIWEICQYEFPVFSDSKDGKYNDTEHDERLRTLVESTGNTIIGSGLADAAVFPNSTALAIQHLAWNGAQGFQSSASQESFTVPALSRNALGPPGWAGGGEMGIVQIERGLAYSTVYRAGHQVPQYQPSAAFRHLELLLGRVKSWSGDEPWTVNISTSFVWPY